MVTFVATKAVDTAALPEIAIIGELASGTAQVIINDPVEVSLLRGEAYVDMLGTFTGSLPPSGTITELEVDTVISKAYEFLGVSFDLTTLANAVADDLPGTIKTIFAGADSLAGSALGDSLSAFGGNDLIDGGPGDDRVNGGFGNDLLTGGSGADSFVFDAKVKAANVDTIADFTILDDTMVLENAIFKALKKDGVLKEKFFHIGKKASDGNDYVIYNEKNGKLLYDRDGEGGKGAKLVATLDAGLDLTHQDFLIA